MDTKIIKRLGKTSPEAKTRLSNIEWVSALDRTKLKYEQSEVILSFHETAAGETVGIQFPGKESDSSRESVFEYDFRPKVRLRDGGYIPDLTFFQIWDALYKNIPITEVGRALLGVIFYRMAYMVDYIEHAPIKLETFGHPVSMELPNGGYLGINYNLIKPLLDDLAFRNTWAGMSFEAFLYYNDLLALNEDVKYWYRSVKLKNEKWKADGVGRVNTMLTHLSVIGFHSDKMNFASLIERFSRSKGVCAAKPEEAVSICSPFLIP